MREFWHGSQVVANPEALAMADFVGLVFCVCCIVFVCVVLASYREYE